MTGWSSLALAVLVGITSAPATVELDRRVAFCEPECPFEHITQTTALCCGEAIATDAAPPRRGPLESETLSYIQELALASDDEGVRNATIRFYSRARRRAYDTGRSMDPEERATSDALLREALALRLPPSIERDPQVIARRRFLYRAGEIAGLALVRSAKLRTSRRTVIRSHRPYEALTAIEAYLMMAEGYGRAATWSAAGGHRHRLDAGNALHDAFMIAVQIRRTDLVCPSLLASELSSPELAFDAKICRGETEDRRALRLELDQMSGTHRRDVALWSRHLRLGYPIQSAAIATAALSVGAASSSLFFNQRYLALCRMTTDELRCVGEEPANASAARGASIAFGIAAPALLLTSGYLFLLRARVKRERQRRRQCAPFVSGGARSAAASLTCRF